MEMKLLNESCTEISHTVTCSSTCLLSGNSSVCIIKPTCEQMKPLGLLKDCLVQSSADRMNSEPPPRNCLFLFLSPCLHWADVGLIRDVASAGLHQPVSHIYWFWVILLLHLWLLKSPWRPLRLISAPSSEALAAKVLHIPPMSARPWAAAPLTESEREKVRGGEMSHYINAEKDSNTETQCPAASTYLLWFTHLCLSAERLFIDSTLCMEKASHAEALLISLKAQSAAWMTTDTAGFLRELRSFRRRRDVSHNRYIKTLTASYEHWKPLITPHCEGCIFIN